MARITLDSEVCRKLDAVAEAVEICDLAGRVIGFFLPENGRPGVPPADLRVPLSDEEVERRRQARSGRTLDVILRGLPSRCFLRCRTNPLP